MIISESAPRQAEATATARTSAAPTAPTAAPNVVYQGELDLAVDDFEQASDNIDRLLLRHKSYLSTAHETRVDGQHRQEMTLKVLPTEFAALVADLGKLGRIENKDISSADVTADMLQAAASVATQQANEAKYQQLLAQTTSPAEVRRLEEQARQLRLTLAADQSRLQQFSARSTWATLTLRYFQVLPETTPSVVAPVFAPQFLAAFYHGWSFLLSVLVVLTNLWPLLLLGGLGAGAIRWWRLRHPVQG
ncbi:DUF4349 domain-containing protein [Hymenobacter sp. H14-R3]|uniref:DUF4349 domain-containing protein n=1 Tax=Hymenobacter sp. H14-R3 TaxID=3046308 RepID=UPI0024B95C27|nr:DUF4349 domain-containing protein [Hymenobacter sp. H14-R3]MDJ0365975.1 DUF4349 domain-containing protein [Hymenobacter sp. H14-R3]